MLREADGVSSASPDHLILQSAIYAPPILKKNVESPRTVKGTAWPILPLPARRSANVPITKSKLVAVSIFRMVKLSVFATKA